jgi:acyl carrier protein
MLEKVKEIIAEHLNVEGIEITPATSFKDDLGADSLDLFELVMAFEEEYGIEIPPEELEGVTTIGNVLELMKSKGAT